MSNAGVPLETVQAWSGHKTALVLLDTYLGVMRGDEEVAVERYQAFLNAVSPVTTPAPGLQRRLVPLAHARLVAWAVESTGGRRGRP